MGIECRDNYSKTRSVIRQDLLSQLEAKGITQQIFADLVDDYMKFWDIKNSLNDDIVDRGVSIYWCNGGGQEGYKKNESISEATKVNTQMLKILSELGIKAADYKVVDSNEQDDI